MPLTGSEKKNLIEIKEMTNDMPFHSMCSVSDAASSGMPWPVGPNSRDQISHRRLIYWTRHKHFFLQNDIVER